MYGRQNITKVYDCNLEKRDCVHNQIVPPNSYLLNFQRQLPCLKIGDKLFEVEAVPGLTGLNINNLPVNYFDKLIFTSETLDISIFQAFYFYFLACNSKVHKFIKSFSFY